MQKARFGILLTTQLESFLYSSIRSMVLDGVIGVSESSVYKKKRSQVVGSSKEWTLLINGMIVEKKQIIYNERSKQNLSNRLKKVKDSSKVRITGA